MSSDRCCPFGKLGTRLRTALSKPIPCTVLTPGINAAAMPLRALSSASLLIFSNTTDNAHLLPKSVVLSASLTALLLIAVLGLDKETFSEAYVPA